MAGSSGQLALSVSKILLLGENGWTGVPPTVCKSGVRCEEAIAGTLIASPGRALPAEKSRASAMPSVRPDSALACCTHRAECRAMGDELQGLNQLRASGKQHSALRHRRRVISHCSARWAATSSPASEVGCVGPTFMSVPCWNAAFAGGRDAPSERLT